MFGRSPYRDLEKKLGYRFRDRSHLESALTHRSFRHETPGIETDNQRLEFLGDAVLGLVTAAWLHDECPDLDEGDLTKRRAAITSSAALAAAGRALGLGEHLRLGRGEQKCGGKHRDRMLEDAVEALLGAVYLDGGLKAVEKVFAVCMRPRLLSAQCHPAGENPKGDLLEWCQRHKLGAPDYVIASEEGPLHDREFRIEVRIGGEIRGSGCGRNKKIAEHAAALDALRALRTTKCAAPAAT
jgi:ribonuclease-3